MPHPKARPARRPLGKYDPAMHAVLLDLMREGASKIEVAAALGVNRRSLDHWVARHPAFAEVMAQGELLAEAWWERQGRINLANKAFNYVGWYMNMKNRFGWRDKHELSGPDGQPLGVVIVPAKESLDGATADSVATDPQAG